MKILILQLTRFGDILCTLPTLSALRRERPDAEIHLMVRKKFAAAAENCVSIDHLWRFDSQKIIKVFVDGSGKIPDAVTELNEVIRDLRAEKFDLIINLSFSPSSTYITHLVSQGGTPVLGYTRTSDFFLRVPDQPSQYFRAQVGLERSNRVHVADLMSWIAGVNLKEQDWITGSTEFSTKAKSGIVCHLGASQSQKMWPEASWVNFLQRLVTSYSETITFVGGPEEWEYAEKIRVQVMNTVTSEDKIINKVGITSFSELKQIIGSSTLYIGADSGPMHVASLTRCPVLNLSVGNVRFWETGPTTRGSRILISENPDLLGSDIVFESASEMIDGRNSQNGFAECTGSNAVRYQVHPKTPTRNDFWSLVEWMYFDGPKPSCGGEIQNALIQICEVCELSLTQLEVFYKSPHKVEVVGVLDRLDEIIDMFQTHIVPLSPLLFGFKTQKENIPPGSREEIFYQTKNCYTELHRRAAQLAGLDLKGTRDGKSLA